jgi:hypothetical protein
MNFLWPLTDVFAPDGGDIFHDISNIRVIGKPVIQIA